MGTDSFEDRDVSIKVLRSVEEVESARSIWEKMQRHQNSNIDFYLEVFKYREDVLRPHVVVVFVKEKPKAMAIARIENTKVKWSIGYLTFLSLFAKSLTLIQDGLLGDQRFSQTLLDHLLKGLKQEKVDLMLLSNIRCDSAFRERVKRGLPMLLLQRIGKPAEHWQLDLSQSYENFLNGFKRKVRYNLLRPGKLIERDYPGGVVFKCRSNPEEVEQVCADAECIARKTYHRGLGVGFINNNEHARRIRLLADQGWLRAYFLYVGGEPIAFWDCTLYGKTLYLNSTGCSHDYKMYEPGTVLLLKVVEDNSASEEVQALDFGLGDAFYKRRYGNVNWKEESFIVFSLRPRGLFLYITRIIPAMFERMARWCIEFLGLEKNLKRIWRNRLARKARNADKR